MTWSRIILKLTLVFSLFHLYFNLCDGWVIWLSGLWAESHYLDSNIRSFTNYMISAFYLLNENGKAHSRSLGLRRIFQDFTLIYYMLESNKLLSSPWTQLDPGFKYQMTTLLFLRIHCFVTEKTLKLHCPVCSHWSYGVNEHLKQE